MGPGGVGGGGIRVLQVVTTQEAFRKVAIAKGFAGYMGGNMANEAEGFGEQRSISVLEMGIPLRAWRAVWEVLES